MLNSGGTVQVPSSVVWGSRLPVGPDWSSLNREEAVQHGGANGWVHLPCPAVEGVDQRRERHRGGAEVSRLVPSNVIRK